MDVLTIVDDPVNSYRRRLVLMSSSLLVNHTTYPCLYQSRTREKTHRKYIKFAEISYQSDRQINILFVMGDKTY